MHGYHSYRTDGLITMVTLLQWSPWLLWFGNYGNTVLFFEWFLLSLSFVSKKTVFVRDSWYWKSIFLFLQKYFVSRSVK